MPDLLPDWRLAQARVNVWDWKIDERRDANVNDPETAALIAAGVIVLVDENTEHVLPPPTPPKSGCGCGS